MNSSLSIILVVLSSIANLQAGSLSLEAHESGTASSYDVRWETNWGSYDRDNHQAKKLLVAVHDLSRKTPKVEVEVDFIAQAQSGARGYLIYKRALIPVELAGRIEATGYVQSPVISSNEKHYAALGEDYSSGLKMAGWIVRGRLGDTIFGVRASNQTLLEIAQNNPRQPLTLDALVAAYEKDHKKED